MPGRARGCSGAGPSSRRGGGRDRVRAAGAQLLPRLMLGDGDSHTRGRCPWATGGVLDKLTPAPSPAEPRAAVLPASHFMLGRDPSWTLFGGSLLTHAPLSVSKLTLSGWRAGEKTPVC